VIHDLRYAARTLLRAPGFAFSAVIALALGIGANTAVFSVVYAVLLQPLPYDEPDRLVRLSERTPEGVDSEVVSAGTFVDWRARTRTLEPLAVYTDAAGGHTLWSVGDRFEVVKTSRVSPALFSVLRVAPILGRTFRPEEEQDKPSGDTGKIVISYGLWQRFFAGAADVVGRSVDQGRL
jgi:putative ABC transport system permease protein